MCRMLNHISEIDSGDGSEGRSFCSEARIAQMHRNETVLNGQFCLRL